MSAERERLYIPIGVLILCPVIEDQQARKRHGAPACCRLTASEWPKPEPFSSTEANEGHKDLATGPATHRSMTLSRGSRHGCFMQPWAALPPLSSVLPGIVAAPL